MHKYDPEGKFQPPNRFMINHINTNDEDVLKSIVLPEPTNQEKKGIPGDKKPDKRQE